MTVLFAIRKNHISTISKNNIFKNIPLNLCEGYEIVVLFNPHGWFYLSRHRRLCVYGGDGGVVAATGSECSGVFFGALQLQRLPVTRYGGTGDAGTAGGGQGG